MSNSFYRGSKGRNAGDSFSLLAGVLCKPLMRNKRIDPKKRPFYAAKSAAVRNKRAVTLPTKPFDWRAE